MFKGLELITDERHRQVSSEMYLPKLDLSYCHDELSRAAIVYTLPDELRSRAIWDSNLKEMLWPKRWDYNPKGRLRDLVRAGALIAAEIDRFLAKEQEDGGG